MTLCFFRSICLFLHVVSFCSLVFFWHCSFLVLLSSCFVLSVLSNGLSFFLFVCLPFFLPSPFFVCLFLSFFLSFCLSFCLPSVLSFLPSSSLSSFLFPSRIKSKKAAKKKTNKCVETIPDPRGEGAGTVTSDSKTASCSKFQRGCFCQLERYWLAGMWQLQACALCLRRTDQLQASNSTCTMNPIHLKSSITGSELQR